MWNCLKELSVIYLCPSGQTSCDFWSPLTEFPVWQTHLRACPCFYNSIATCSLLLTLVNLILRSAAARKIFLLALCDAQIFTLGYESWPNLWQSQSISSRICCSHSPGTAGEAPSYLTFYCCSPSAPPALSSFPEELFVTPATCNHEEKERKMLWKEKKEKVLVAPGSLEVF